MNKAYQKWLPYIERDLRAANRLYRGAVRDKSTNWYDWMLIIWNCHQVIEKSLKMITVHKSIELPLIHDLARLCEITGTIADLPTKWRKSLNQLAQYYITPKYPDLSLKKLYPRANKEIAKKYLHFAKNFYTWTTKQLSLKK